MIRKLVVATILGIPASASGATAQEGRWQEIGVQGTGFFTKDSSGNGIDQHERPDFQLDALHSGITTHTAQPSAGMVFRF
jgi:hypothetical protein